MAVETVGAASLTIALVGQPNVGKSVIMNELTGAGAIVSNYPGTTVDITEGWMPTSNGRKSRIRIIDTPGAYSLYSQSDEQRVTQSVLARGDIDLIVNVVDASRLDRNLSLTLQLLDLNIPMIVALNQMDLARELGQQVDVAGLSQELGVPVIPLVAVRGDGIEELRDLILETAPAILSDTSLPSVGSPRKRKSRGILKGDVPLLYSKRAKDIAASVTTQTNMRSKTFRASLESLIDRPFPGVLLMVAVVGLSTMAVRWFLGLAETAVSLLFDPLVSWFMETSNSFDSNFVRILFEAIPEGIILPISVVLPAMVAIYSMMALLEDTGLMPRIAVAMHRLTSLIGVPGQAIIPLILAFGCRVPAILATRSIPSKQARFVLAALLSITIPCAATIGIVAALAEEFEANLGIVYGTAFAVFVMIGVVLGRLVPKEEREIILEMPPLRLPSLSNVVSKVRLRSGEFFTHVLPILVLTSIGIQVALSMDLLAPLARLDGLSNRYLGLGGQSLAAVGVSIVQRYMGPMVLLNLPLSAREATIAGAMICVSLPCLPTSVIAAKEYGLRSLAVIIALAAGICLAVGLVLNVVL